MKRIIAVVGPTGIGKSDLALRLANAIPSEIISADSRQVYRGMDIGTSKPAPYHLQAVPHHLVDIIEPDQSFSLAEYQKLAFTSIETVHDKGKVPILAGGSGQYVWSVLENWDIPPVAPDESFRSHLEKRAADGEADELYEELQKTDAAAAVRIDRRNVRRVIRALELTRNGNPRAGKNEAPFASLIFGLTAERKYLYGLIDRRADDMIAAGLVDEVRSLLDKGYSLDLAALSGIGYRQIGQYVQGRITLEAAVRNMKTSSHRLARQQYNWFKLKDGRIIWFTVEDDPYPRILKLVEDFLKKDY